MEWKLLWLVDPAEGTFLGRTPGSWLLIIIFYVVYYAALVSFFFALLGVFFQTLPSHGEGPKYTVEKSFIGDPGISSLPSSSYHAADSSIYNLELYDSNSVPTLPDGEGSLNADYAQKMKFFLEQYGNKTVPVHLDKSKGYSTFDLEDLGDCAKHPYGYISEEKNGTLMAIQPCIFLKLNRIWSWTPSAITDEDFHPDSDWPESLRSHFKTLSKEEKQQVFVDCQGNSATDQEAMKEGVSVFPKTKGFPIAYFPFLGHKEMYRSPLIAIRFDGRLMERFLEEVLTINCRAFFKGGTSQGVFRLRFQRRNFS